MGLNLRLVPSMGGPLTASMSLDFTGLAGMMGLITVSGGTNGTRVNSSGTIVASPAPRFDYNPVSLASRGILIEEARTNLCTGSTDFSNATYWSPGANIAFTAGQLAPDGSTNAVQAVCSGAGNFIAHSNATITAATAYDGAVYIKPISGSGTVRLTVGKTDETDGAMAQFTQSGTTLTYSSTNVQGAGTVVTPGSATAVGNGWYRLAMASTSAGTLGSLVVLLSTGSTVWLWGAQHELGSFATSFISTTSASVTRTADSLTMTGGNFSSWWNAAQGTIAITAASPASGTRTIWQADDGTANNRITIYTTGTTLNMDVLSGGVSQASITIGTITANTSFKVACSWSASGFAGSVNGAAAVTSGAGTVPTVTTARIGSDLTPNVLCEHFIRASYYPTVFPSGSLPGFST